MISPRDRDLGLNRRISRRDFLDGVAIATGGLAAASIGAGLEGMAGLVADVEAADLYPPALTGMRGTHDGAWETAHDLRDDRSADRFLPATDTGERYDLVVVGAGISGLAAAHFYHQTVSRQARILVLDNHDDFGGHAKRNEFRPGGRFLIAYGGTQSIETPSPYSREARGLLADLGIDPPALAARAAKDDAFEKRRLKNGIFFDRETFGADRLVVGSGTRPWPELLASAPLSADAKRDIARIEEGEDDYLAGLSDAEKKDRLWRISYREFLLTIAKAHPDVLPFYQTRTHDLYGVGIDAVPALDGWGIGLSGFQGLKLAPGPAPHMSLTAAGEASPDREPYDFHFPDGNASIARLLVRRLVPGALPGRTVDDSIKARVDYGRLDQSGSSVKIRLKSTVVRARHLGDADTAREVEVVYVREGKSARVTASHCVLACWHMVVPYLCPELPESQRAALAYGAKVPLVYTNVAIRNWTSLQTLDVSRISCPGSYHTSVALDEPVHLGGYDYPGTPSDATVLNLVRTPCRPGLPAREQQRRGRYELLAVSFETFERNIRDQLGRILGPGGFDPARDVTAITVNRWPHGYTYEYNPLWDPDWPEAERPCVVARRRFGRIAIANADAAAYAYTDAAIDQAFRAVSELRAI